MTKIIIIMLEIFLLVMTSNAIQQDVFILNLMYDKGEISTQLLTVAKGYFHEPADQPEDGYRLEIISFDNKILYSQKFDFQLEVVFGALPEWFDEQGNQIYIPNESETKLTRDTATIELILPYFKDARRIDIYDNKNELKLSIDVSGFAEETKLIAKKSYRLKTISYSLLVIVVIILFFLIFKLIRRKLQYRY